MKRESFGSRLGFILVSAGCAIGIGNVWKFPYICGAYGGAAFILIYLLFLIILGIPVLVCEFAVGRGSRKSVALSFDELQSKMGNGPIKIYWNHRMLYVDDVLYNCWRMIDVLLLQGDSRQFCECIF